MESPDMFDLYLVAQEWHVLPGDLLDKVSGLEFQMMRAYLARRYEMMKQG